MLFPGTAATPNFDGSNQTEFLEVYDDMCNNYQVLDSERLKSLPRYCESLLKEDTSEPL